MKPRTILIAFVVLMVLTCHRSVIDTVRALLAAASLRLLMMTSD